jgi:hypothetical protein
MKKLSLILFTLIVHCSAFNQVWIDSGAVWHYDYWNISEMGFIKHVYSKDTVIQNKNCQKISTTMYRFTFNQYDSLVQLGSIIFRDNFTYVSGDTVFYLNNDEFFVLYDFGASIGNQWIISYTNEGFDDCDDTSRIVVTDTGSIFINEIRYKFITVQPTSNSSMGLRGTYVERFGNLDLESGPFQSLFPGDYQCDSLTVAVEWTYLHFKCFMDTSFTLYNPSSEDCEYYLTHLGTEELNRDEILCYPVPTKDILKIKHNFKSDFIAQFFSYQGILVKTYILNRNDHTIDLSQLSNGMYLIKFQNEEGNFIRKIIKE